MEPVDATTPAQTYLLRRARAAGVPLGVHIDLTYECDLACVHCYLADRRRRELTLDEYRSLFDELRELGTLHLLVSGGEIFYRDDAIEILRAARERRFEVRLITHGGRIDEAIADALAEMGIACTSMSIYASNARQHDAVTKVPGSWERTLRGARLLINRGMTVKFKCVLMRINPTEISAMRELARDVGCCIDFSVDIKGGNNGSDDLMGLNLNAADKVAMLGCVYPSLADATSAEQFSPDRYTCMAGNASCYIGPDGSVQPCLDWEQVAGQLRETSFTEIWKSSAVFLNARAIRRSSFTGCTDCTSFGSCNLCPARAYRETGSTTGSAPSVCRETLARTLARSGDVPT